MLAVSIVNEFEKTSWTPSICTNAHGLKEDLFNEGGTLNDTDSTCNRVKLLRIQDL
jgi:hypothetical protein